jgi:hypothetical protein
MPISAENRKRYPADWKTISKRIRSERAEDRCECAGECGTDHEGRCDIPNGEMIWRHASGGGWNLIETYYEVGNVKVPVPPKVVGVEWAPKATKVILTVAHLDHAPENCSDGNLKAMCQRCHLRYDQEHHAESRKRSKAARPLARVVINVGYVVYKDDQDMIEYAQQATYEDVMNAVKHNELETWIEVLDAPDAKESDIPDFLLEDLDEGDSQCGD